MGGGARKARSNEGIAQPHPRLHGIHGEEAKHLTVAATAYASRVGMLPKLEPEPWFDFQVSIRTGRYTTENLEGPLVITMLQ